MKNIIFSLVLYKHTINEIKPLLNSIQNLSLNSSISFSLVVYDGSPPEFSCAPTQEDLVSLLPHFPLHHTKGINIGYGPSHNFNFHIYSHASFDYFIVVNPDISFESSDLLPFIYYCIEYPSLGCASPLIMNSQYVIQYSAKHNPTFLSLALGRFSLLRVLPVFRSYDAWHRNLTLDYSNSIIRSTYLSGCFLLIASSAYYRVGGFSEQYFLHLEDADIVRKLSLHGDAFQHPIGKVYHRWARGSHKSFVQTFHLLNSYLSYVRNWGFELF